MKAVAEAFGYTPEELASIPAEANMALSCGNPTATANLRPGETVVDLGSGGGLDVFLAARKVGPTGRAIGIDMTPEMLDLARRNAEKAGLTNVEFHLATIDKLPLPDASADCVISNCVINLAPDKPAVFREIARVLKPGGRLAVSDIALKRELPPELGDDLMAYVGCIAGAITIEEYRRGLIEAGFAHVEVIDSGSDLNAYAKVENQAACCPPPSSSAIGPGRGRCGVLLGGSGGGRGRGAARPAGRPAAAVRRERLRRQREGLRRQAPVTVASGIDRRTHHFLTLGGRQEIRGFVIRVHGRLPPIVRTGLGEFVWHRHEHEDELFLFVKGRFRMDFRGRQVWVGVGEFLIVPRGVEHRPVAEEEVHVLLFEPATTLNTGNVRDERTVDEPERI